MPSSQADFDELKKVVKGISSANWTIDPDSIRPTNTYYNDLTATIRRPQPMGQYEEVRVTVKLDPLGTYEVNVYYDAPILKIPGITYAINRHRYWKATANGFRCYRRHTDLLVAFSNALADYSQLKRFFDNKVAALVADVEALDDGWN